MSAAVSSNMEGLALTADHAARGKCAAVAEGYWQDDFARSLSAGAFDGSPGPMINRGQYARVAAVSSAYEQFLVAVNAAGESAQIVSLGAGFDSCFWKLNAASAAPRLYVEIDQRSIVQRKCAMISTRAALHRAFPEGKECVGPEGILSGASGYRLVAADLNNIAQLEAALERAGWDPSKPTLVVAECLLCYMPPEASKAMLEWFGARAARAVLVAYEMVHPGDPFGRTMMNNLRQRGCPLLGLPAVPDCAAQEARCLATGWERAEAVEMLAYFDEVVGKDERKRICQISLLDELEEWQMLMTHYSILLAVQDKKGDGPPLFGDLRLRAPALLPPLSALGVGRRIDGSGDAQVSTKATTKAPPLGDIFREEDEDAVWSDDEELDHENGEA
jgi:tRNA wybutosine-synthesizing protein 4